MADLTIEWQLNRTLTAPVGGDTLEMSIGQIDLDVITVETYDFAAEVTEHPVEEGVNIADHVRPSLQRVSLEAIISNTPIRSTLDYQAMVRPASLVLPSWAIQGVRVLRFDREFDRPRDVIDQLEALMAAGIAVDLIGTRFGDREGFLITTVSAPVENDNAVSFTMDLQELRTATTQEVEAPSPLVERGRPPTDRGGQGATDADESSQTQVSALQALRTAAGV